MDLFGAARKKPPLPKICHTYPTMMKFGTVIPSLKKIQKLYQSLDTHPELCCHQHFFTRNQQILHFDTEFLILWTFLKSLKIFLVHLVIILMMSAKMATPGLLKILVSWNKGYDVIIPVDDLTNKFLSRDSNYIVDLFKWPKLGNSSICMREVITTLIL